MADSGDDKSKREIARREGNFCIGTGLGVAALGVGGAVVAGAVCPLCYIVPPALVGLGVWRRRCSAGPTETSQAPVSSKENTGTEGREKEG